MFIFIICSNCLPTNDSSHGASDPSGIYLQYVTFALPYLGGIDNSQSCAFNKCALNQIASQRHIQCEKANVATCNSDISVLGSVIGDQIASKHVLARAWSSMPHFPVQCVLTFPRHCGRLDISPRDFTWDAAVYTMTATD